MKNWQVWVLRDGQWVEDESNPHRALSRTNVLDKFKAKDGQSRNGTVKVRKLT